ncbi:MAG: 30S ribosomal protein S17 [Deltaproteobacteria bacterium]|nr:30S ribosomal protein S17 [Deltaproteobacteria bacterium]
MENKRRIRKTRMGTVISDKMGKTVVVSVENLVKHPLYGKYIKKRVKFMAHDEKNDCKIGDKVLIVESRPISKNKVWRVKEVLERATV